MEKIIGILLGLLIAMFAINVISGAIALVLWTGWHYVAVPSFHAPELTFLQIWIATGVLLSIKAIFRKNK